MTGKSRGPELVRSYYRTYDEWGRLVRDSYHELELSTTLHYLRRYLPPRGLILDAGGGPGRYSIELARRGYRMVLLDFTPELLNKARGNTRRAGVASRVRQVVEGTVVDLSRFESDSFDGVLCLGGPLNHVLTRRARSTAVGELARVAREGSPIIVSVIGRLTPLVDGLIRHPEGLRTDPQHHRRILRTGDYDGHRGFAPSHFFATEEVVDLLREQRLQVLEKAGLEGLASYHEREINRLARNDPRAWAAWKALHLQTCTNPSVVATSEHFLVVARK